jgi:hypothetical protein
MPLAVQAQSGDALARAEYACMDNGVRPSSTAFNACVNRTARAYDRGEPELAYRTARTASDARDLCLSYGLAPATLGYRQCIANAMDSRAVNAYPVRYVPSYVEPPRAAATIDEYGNRYDRLGNRLDRDGYVIPAPYTYISAP